MTSTEQTLGELVTAYPGAAKVFHRYGLDFCCGGKQSLDSACATDRLDADALLREIEDGAGAEQKDVRWDQRPIAELVQHILNRYHAPLRTEIPRLIGLANAVESAHADKPDRPDGLKELLEDIRTAVETHLEKEEKILFPLILGGRGENAHMPVQVIMQEHEDHGRNLRRIRELTGNLRLPEYACASWRELYRALAELEVDLMEHIHLENNILFPRALGGVGSHA